MNRQAITPVPGQGAAPGFRFMNGDFSVRAAPDLSRGRMSVHDTERLAEIPADHGMVVTGPPLHVRMR